MLDSSPRMSINDTISWYDANALLHHSDQGRAKAEGSISPEEAQTIAAVLETSRRSIESEEFEQRIAALERQPK